MYTPCPGVNTISGVITMDTQDKKQAALQAVTGEEQPISSAYPAIDNDLARDNLENDIPAADLQDL